MMSERMQTTQQVSGADVQLGDKVHTGWQDGGYVVRFEAGPNGSRDAVLDTGQITRIWPTFNYSITRS